MRKEEEYAKKIIAQISEMFNPGESENFIDEQELLDEANAKAFIHALATVAPNWIYNNLTDENNNSLEFNHIANHLVFEFSTLVKN